MINGFCEVGFHSALTLQDSLPWHERKMESSRLAQRRSQFPSKKRLALRRLRVTLLPQFLLNRGHSLMVKLQPSKLAMRVRFSLPALNQVPELIRMD